ncbi:MAG: Rne/Rng family ribonuclease [Acidimicrobiales bacterium]|nr:Rne/Rng family ribonuclease [Acidimicrobiales bacterium]
MDSGAPKNDNRRGSNQKPRVGDSRPSARTSNRPDDSGDDASSQISQRQKPQISDTNGEGDSKKPRSRRGSSSKSRQNAQAKIRADYEAASITDEASEFNEKLGKALGRYLVCVHASDKFVQLAILEGRTLVEHYVSRPTDDANQVDGNIYMGRVKNVLPGMEAAFVDIGTPKNAVLYKGDVRDDHEDVETSDKSQKSGSKSDDKFSDHDTRIEDVLKNGQMIVCQVTKNPIGVKGARLTQEVSIAGRFVVLVPGGTSIGISKRLEDTQRRRLRKIIDQIKPEGHGLIVRTAASNATSQDLDRDIKSLVKTWARVEEKAKKVNGPALLHREPHMVLKVLREELNSDYRGVLIDDADLFLEARNYIESVNPEYLDRVFYYDKQKEALPIFERFHIHEQLHKALDRQVWLPSGGSLIIEHTEALTVIDVNTSKNVGSSNLEETVYQNNLEAAEEVARQLRLRDIGGIIVIDFIDMSVRQNRTNVMSAFRSALARDKTRTQAFDISDLGLVEMTRKRISEGLVDSLSHKCPECNGRGIILDTEMD